MSSSGVRERKRGANNTDPPQAVELDDKKLKSSDADGEQVNLEPEFGVVIALLLAFATVLGIFFYYKVDDRPPAGAFASWINGNVLEPLQEFLTPPNRYQKGGL